MPRKWINACLIVLLLVSVVPVGTAWAAAEEPFTFVTISDVHIPGYGFPIELPLDEATLMGMHNPQRIKQFVDECLALSPKPPFVINAGDTGDAGWTEFLMLYRKLMQPLLNAGIPVFTVVGNHDLDYAGIGREDLAEMFDSLGPAKIGRGGTRYSFDYGGCHFAVLNDRPVSGLIRLNPKDIEWLRDDLKKVKKDTRVLLFMHANLPLDDTIRIVELLQDFDRPTIFHGHSHSATIGAWGGVPVVVTGALYGGRPEAGSYRIISIAPEGITVRTRDFAKPAGTFEPVEAVAIPPRGPRMTIAEPKTGATVNGTMKLRVTAKPAVPGTVEYQIPGFNRWTPIEGGDGAWEASIALPEEAGRYFVAVQFKGQDGAVTMGHTNVTVTGGAASEAWSRDLGSAVQGRPVVAGELVVVPTIEGGVYALRLTDGKEVWHREGEGQIIGRMAAGENAVYYASGRTVYACDPAKGRTIWTATLDGTVIAGMTLAGGRLFVPAGERAVYGIDAKSGKVLWTFEAGRPVIMEPASDGKRVYFGAMDGFFRALDAASGTEVWKRQVSNMTDIYTTAPYWEPVVAGDTVVMAKGVGSETEQNLVAFSAADGSTRWSRRFTGGRMRLVADARNARLFASFRENRRSGVQCYSLTDGEPVWGNANGIAMVAGTLRGGKIYYRDDNEICCVAADTGVEQWRYMASTGPQGSLYGPEAFVVTDTRAVVATMDGVVVALKW